MPDFNQDSLRQLPFSMTAEQSLLGSILIDPESITQIADIIHADDFYIENHQSIYLAMSELFQTNQSIDPTLLIDKLVTKGLYDKSGGETYIRSLVQAVPNALNIKDYAKIVRDKSLLRQLIGASNDISSVAMSEQEPVEQILDYAENQIFNVAQGRDTKNFQTLSEVLQSVYGNLKDLYEKKEGTQGTATGFSGLDKVLAGIGSTDLVLIGARPGMGKTSFALNIGTNVAKATGKAVAIFSLEMSAEQLVTRILSSEALVDSYALRTGDLNDQDWQNLAQAADSLYGCNILIDDTSGQTVTAMKAKLRRIHKGLGMVIIDYLQLMQGDTHNDNRVQEVADISRGLKIMAKELEVPVVCCAQLSRGPEGRTDKKPMLSDLRDSGAIEQDADTVMFLYRPEYYNTDNQNGNDESSIAEVIIAKNRHGATGSVQMGWIGRYTKFRTISDPGMPDTPPAQ